MIEGKEKEKLSLRERFYARGHSIANYARAFDLDRETLKAVMRGSVNGKNNTKQQKARTCILKLKEDEIWLEKIPWEERVA